MTATVPASLIVVEWKVPLLAPETSTKRLAWPDASHALERDRPARSKKSRLVLRPLASLTLIGLTEFAVVAFLALATASPGARLVIWALASFLTVFFSPLVSAA